MARVVKTLVATAFSFLISIPPAMGQQTQAPAAQAPDPMAPISAQKLTKEQKKKISI